MPTNPANILLSPIHRLWHHHWRLILIIVALVVVLIWGLALLQPERFSDDVWTLHLRDCDLDYHIPIRSIALACPGLDYMHGLHAALAPARRAAAAVEQPRQETPDPLPDWVPDRYAWR